MITRATSGSDDAEVLFILNELNIFHLLQFPALCAFKLFFWQKSNLDFPEYREIQYDHAQKDSQIAELSGEITDLFVRVNTIELTTEECLNSILKQLVFYDRWGRNLLAGWRAVTESQSLQPSRADFCTI
ncbi:MAG: hypothetical protein EHM46_04280 [Bacteroidetes bacterium]|nr:MAG: hypothetical protein EHM46_04280 [Bacteroidota bacterium]